MGTRLPNSPGLGMKCMNFPESFQRHCFTWVNLEAAKTLNLCFPPAALRVYRNSEALQSPRVPQRCDGNTPHCWPSAGRSFAGLQDAIIQDIKKQEIYKKNWLIKTYTWWKNIRNFCRPSTNSVVKITWFTISSELSCNKMPWCPANLKNIEIAIVTTGQALSLPPCAVEHMPRGAVGRKNGRTAMKVLGAKATGHRCTKGPVVVLRGRYNRYQKIHTQFTVWTPQLPSIGFCCCLVFYFAFSTGIFIWSSKLQYLPREE